MARPPTRILIVDDEPNILSTTKLLLETFGYEVVTCNRADRILATIRETRPDLLLQDLRMPGLDLDSVVPAIRADATFAQLPIIIFTANPDAEEIVHRIGADRLLDKPFYPRDLQAAVEQTLETRPRLAAGASGANRASTA